MKKFGVFLVLMAAMLVAVPAVNNAWAAQRGPASGPAAGPNAGWQHPAVSPEKQGAYEKIILDYHNAVQPLQNDLWAKQTELHYVPSDADPKVVNKLVNDVKVAREKVQKLNDTTAAKLAKELDISMPHAYSLLANCGMGCGYHRGWGYHNGPRGYHHNGPNGYYDNAPRGGYYDGPRGYHRDYHRGYHRGY